MKKFIVHLSNKQRHLMTEQLIKEHIDYLRQLKQQGVLPFCGPCQDGTAMMILTCGSMEEAQSLLENDPFSKVDYYLTRNVVEVEEADESNNFHLEQVLDYLSSRT